MTKPPFSPDEQAHIDQLISEKHPDNRVFVMGDTLGQPDGIRYETIRGVTLPIEPGMSKLRIEIERNKARKRMKEDDRKLARIEQAIREQQK